MYPRVIYLCFALVASMANPQLASSQHSLDIDEAVARGAALDLISESERHFDCKIDEYSMREIGDEPNIRYIFRVTAHGVECGEAMAYLTRKTYKDGLLLFRQISVPTDASPDPISIDNYSLINDIDPGLAEDQDLED